MKIQVSQRLKKNNQYWETRVQRIFDEKERGIKVDELYRRVYNDMHEEVKALYDELGDRELTRTELYKASKFLSFRSHLQKDLTDISGSLDDKMSRALIGAYKDAGLAAKDSIGAKTTWTVTNRKMAEAAVQRKWAGDNFSGRIWKNRGQLAKTVEKGITEILTTGHGRNELIRELTNEKYRRERFVPPKGADQSEIEAQFEAYLQRGRRQAETLVRTELMHAINTGQIETYRFEGVKYISFECEPTACPDCVDIAAENPYPIDKIPCTIGHPRCRCTWLPVEDEDIPESVKERDGIKEKQPENSGETEKDIDISQNHGIIESGGNTVALENQRYGRNKNTLVNKTYIDSGEYRRKFDKITDNAEINRTLYSAAKEMLLHRSGTNLEDMYWIHKNTGEIIAKETDQRIAQTVVYSKSTVKAVSSHRDGELIAIHNHPNSMPPSIEDFNSCNRNNYAVGYVACHNGKVYGYRSSQYISTALYNAYIGAGLRDGLSEFEAQFKALVKLCSNHMIEFWEVH